MIAPLDGKQRESAATATARVCVWEGSVRSGKTIASLLAWLRFVRDGPPGNLLLVGKTERTVKRNIVDVLTEMLGHKRCRFVSGSGELWLLGRRVYVAGANDERAQEKIRGLTLAGAYVDEASTIPESFWAMLLTRLSVEGARCFATTNPEGPRHWLKRDYLDRAATVIERDGSVVEGDDGGDLLDLARFRFTLQDNPHLPPAYVAEIERTYKGLWRRRYILGEWVAAEGAVFPMLDTTTDGDASHVVSMLPRGERYWLAVDHGVTNPTHAVLIAQGSDQRLYAAAEWRDQNKTDAEYADGLEQWIADGCDGALGDHGVVDRVYVDPAAPGFVRELHRRGWPAGPAADDQVSTRVVDGIRDLASLFARRRLLVHERCGILIDELSGYAWDEKASERGEDQPIKQDDHGPDALRYGVRMVGHVWRRWTDLGAAA